MRAECASAFAAWIGMPTPERLEDYAFVSARRPNVDCDMLAPFVDLPTPIDGKDVMVVGKGKPFLSRDRDQARLKAYAEAFESLRRSAMV